LRSVAWSWAAAAVVLLRARAAWGAEPEGGPAPRTWGADDKDKEEGDADLGDLEEEALGPRGNLRTRAESVSFDAKQRSLELTGNVRVDAPPFHLRSPHITLARTRYGIEVEGDGRLAFCPCLGTPVTIEFTKAIVAPPGELFLRDPKLEIYGFPVLYLPWFWMRSDEKIGVLPPDIAYRGQDGVYVGEGIHLPWKDRGARQALDLRGGAYLNGGFVADARLRSPIATTKIRYDRLPGARAPVLPVDPASRDTEADDGLLVDARGASHDKETTIAWDADLLRGRRGVAATSELDAAAKPWDRAAWTGALAFGALTAETGVRAVTRRGGSLTAIEAAGPFLALRSSGTVVSPAVTYDAVVEGGALRTSGNAASVAALQPPSLIPDSVSYTRAELGTFAATNLGPIATSFTARGAANLAAEGRRQGGSRAATTRLRFGVPLARAFAQNSAEDPSSANDPLIHVIEPFAEAAVLHTSGDAILGTLPGRGLAALAGTAPIADAGVTSTLGRWGQRQTLEIAVAGGAAYGSRLVESGLRPLARGRLAATTTWFGAQVESGHVLGDEGTRGGSAVVGRMRVGRDDRVRVLGNVAAREGLDPILSRALTDAALEVPAGFLSRSGTTGGASVVVPWGRPITTSVGADADLTATELVAARAGIELHDRCNCLTLRANGAHRIGRSGVDVWVALDFVSDR
jgi:hypothetical protein